MRSVRSLFPRDQAQLKAWFAEYREHPEEWRYGFATNAYFHKDGKRAIPAEAFDQ